MKQYACNRLYVNEGDSFSNQVVVIADDGKVERYFPLKDEIRNTIWIGGTVIIKNSYAWFMPGIASYDYIDSNYMKCRLLK